jgi:hypothetical protein
VGQFEKPGIEQRLELCGLASLREDRRWGWLALVFTQSRKAAKKPEIESDPRREKRFICLMIYFFVILSFYQRD